MVVDEAGVATASTASNLVTCLRIVLNQREKEDSVEDSEGEEAVPEKEVAWAEVQEMNLTEETNKVMLDGASSHLTLPNMKQMPGAVLLKMCL